MRGRAPGAPLPEPKHEAFAQGVARGDSSAEAYRAAGYGVSTDASARAAAGRLIARPEVAERIAEIQRAAAERNAIQVDRVLEEWRRIAFSDLRRVMSWGEEGETLKLKASSQLADEDAAAIEAVSEEMTGTGFKFKVKLHSKIDALKFLSKYLGIDGEGVVTEEPLADRLRRLAENRVRAAGLAEKVKAKLTKGAA